MNDTSQFVFQIRHFATVTRDSTYGLSDSLRQIIFGVKLKSRIYNSRLHYKNRLFDNSKWKRF